MSFLVLQSLTKRFGDVTVVDGLSLAVEKGEFVSLLGPSGCGKTTTLQMIAGFVEPSAGTINLGGRDLTKIKPAARGLGIVFQSYALFPHMTAAENIAFGLEMRGVARPEQTKRVADALALVGLAGFSDRYPRRMSGGQQQRVALARALVIKPDVLLLDEPLSNLDAKLREEMQVELRQIQRTVGTTTVLVTHDQGEAMALSDRIVVMNRGRAEHVARPTEIYRAPATAFVANFLGKINVLPADISNGVARIGTSQWSAAGMADGLANASVRPERIAFSDSEGLAGTVKTRIFQGHHWLLHVATEVGLVLVITPNDGRAVPEEDSTVRLTWRAEDMTLTRAESAA
ncbi:MAG: putative spermidine/putrescine transport system ATP-binding protein [Hyphomicrobiales bacterium]|jgi:putative spermidine/putrescine transport system ATP-binding protein